MNSPARSTVSDLSALVGRASAPLVVVLIVGLWVYTRGDAAQTVDVHDHAQGTRGGVLVAVEGQRYHVEAVVEPGGMLRLYTLGADASRLIDVRQQPLTAHVNAGALEAIPIPLNPEPQPGDARGRTSQFIGQLPAELAGKPFGATIANLHIGSGRYRIGLAWGSAAHDAVMPVKVSDEAERELYLTPGGKYTDEDIAANGRTVPSAKFRGFRAQHDFAPQPGDRLCPISRTKANPDCAWVINGERYEFCCPPCIDELVMLAKEKPGSLEPPKAFVADGPAGDS